MKIRKVDKGSNEVKEVGANSTFNGDFWIPRTNKAEEYKKQRMTISLDGKNVFRLWQEGANVRFGASDGHVGNAPTAPGLSKLGGDPTLFIEIVNNTPIFVFSSN